MRITPEQVEAILAATQDLAGEGASVRLFGSRLNDALRGGDIDLLVDCARPVARPVWLAAQLTARLQRLLGERRVDVLLAAPGMAEEPVHRLARADGIVLKACDG